MKYYNVVQFTVTNPDWIPEYSIEVTKLLENWGAKYLSRTNNIEAVEGRIKEQTSIVIVEWPSKEVAESFYNSEEYRPYRNARILGSEGTFLLIPGEDVTNESKLGVV